jgi:hypothetical protein
MKLKLHDNFFIELGEHIETKWRTTRNEYGHKELEPYEEKKFYPIAIHTKAGSLVCFANEINEFLELLGAFISNQLNIGKHYGFKYKNGGGFYGKVVFKEKTADKKISYLGLQIAEKENYILEKYDCRVIIANAKQILSKCILKDLI